MPLLPFQRMFPRKTLVIDLDHTLVDSAPISKSTACTPDYIYTDTAGRRAKVFLRPFVREFLWKVRKHFELVLFTAAPAAHADAVLDFLDPQRCIFEYRLYLQHTSPTPEWPYVKDLSRLGRNLSQTLLIDDCRLACLNKMENWIGVPAFSQGPSSAEDNVLKELLPFLLNKVLPAEDVRQVIAAGYDNKKRCPLTPPESQADENGASEEVDSVSLSQLSGASVAKPIPLQIAPKKRLVPCAQSAPSFSSSINLKERAWKPSLDAVKDGLIAAASMNQEPATVKEVKQAETPVSTLEVDAISRASSWDSTVADTASGLVSNLSLSSSANPSGAESSKPPSKAATSFGACVPAAEDSLNAAVREAFPNAKLGYLGTYSAPSGHAPTQAHLQIVSALAPKHSGFIHSAPKGMQRPSSTGGESPLSSEWEWEPESDRTTVSPGEWGWNWDLETDLLPPG